MDVSTAGSAYQVSLVSFQRYKTAGELNYLSLTNTDIPQVSCCYFIFNFHISEILVSGICNISWNTLHRSTFKMYT